MQIAVNENLLCKYFLVRRILEGHQRLPLRCFFPPHHAQIFRSTRKKKTVLCTGSSTNRKYVKEKNKHVSLGSSYELTLVQMSCRSPSTSRPTFNFWKNFWRLVNIAFPHPTVNNGQTNLFTMTHSILLSCLLSHQWTLYLLVGRFTHLYAALAPCRRLNTDQCTTDRRRYSR